jgi:hypothetical protein
MITSTMGDLSNNISFGCFKHNGYDREMSKIGRQEFKKMIQRNAWSKVFGEMNMDKYVTSSVRSTLNKFIEDQREIPFTFSNVFRMIELIMGTRQQRMDGMIVEAFDKICSFSDKNNSAGEKWKTNSNYKINKIFIHDYMCKHDNRWPKSSIEFSSCANVYTDDIVKALCYLTGENYDDFIPLESFFRYPYHFRRTSDNKLMGGYHNCAMDYKEARTRQAQLREAGIETEIEKTGNSWGEWYPWAFWEIKGHKKGTMHFKWQKEKHLDMFNKAAGKLKGWTLPDNTDTKRTGRERTKSNGVELFVTDDW